MKKILLLIIIVVLGVFFSYLNYVGVFTSIEVFQKEIGPYIMVYTPHIGAYKDTGKVMNNLYYSLLDDENVETFKGIGIYYDNPKDVPEEKLRSDIGCVLEKNDYSRVDDLKKKYRIKEIKKGNYLVASFPYRSKFSIIVGVIKVYPAFDAYMDKNGLKPTLGIEVYDLPNKEILYIRPIERK